MRKIYEVFEYDKENGIGERVAFCSSPEAVVKYLTYNNHKRFTLTGIFGAALEGDWFCDNMVLRRKRNDYEKSQLFPGLESPEFEYYMVREQRLKDGWE